MLTADAQYAANIQALSADPTMGPLVQQLANTPLVNFLPGFASDGHMIGAAWDVATQKWVALCEPEQPLEMAERATTQIWSAQQTVFTLIGIGMGYAVAAIAKRLLPYQRLVVWDPEPVF